MQKYKVFWKRIVALFKEKDVFHHASAITFNLIICGIPFVLLLISIIGYILSYEAAMSEVLRYGQEVFPSFSAGEDLSRGAATLQKFLDPLVSARQVFGLVGLGILIVFSLGLIHTIKHVIFVILDVKDRHHLVWEYIHNFFTFGLIGGLFVFLSITISIFSILSVQTVTLPFTNEVIELSGFYRFLRSVIPLLFTLLISYILFRYVSEKRLKRLAAFVGACVFTFMFTLARYGVGIYLNYSFSRYHYYYQGYTVPVIIGVWAFYSAALLIVATIVARAYQDTYLKSPLKENPYDEIS
ncbi:MAG TPA: YihY/virulence factor BrkB family protein [Balneolaceae bacterium]|nr:YihY/virulence factor BrkB family protein [Balneolaceae bacterium]